MGPSAYGGFQHAAQQPWARWLLHAWKEQLESRAFPYLLPPVCRARAGRPQHVVAAQPPVDPHACLRSCPSLTRLPQDQPCNTAYLLSCSFYGTFPLSASISFFVCATEHVVLLRKGKHPGHYPSPCSPTSTFAAFTPC